MKTNELRELSDVDLNNELHSTLKEIFNLKMQKSSGEFEKPHLMKRARRQVARIKTLITERVSEANG